MFFQFNSCPSELGGVCARLQKQLQILQASLAGRRGLLEGFLDRLSGGSEFVCVFKFACQLVRALNVKLIHLPPAIFELRKIGGIKVQLLRHLHLAETQAFSGGNQKFAFIKIS